MAIELDHFIVSCRDKKQSAQTLGELLGVPWAEHGLGPFAPVYINAGLTLDFIETDEEFHAILGRIKAAGIPYRSTVRGPVDGRICTEFGGLSVYWNVPDGHQWEMLTSSYARQPDVNRGT
jgi:catechol 2,3-dioxygenase-like lactoylglutathione lyase family enzyme